MREYSSEHAKACLHALGMTVFDIEAVQDGNRADLLATYQNENYLVEAKLRTEHEDWLQLLQQAHMAGIDMLTREIKPWNALSSMIQKAYKQLLATPAPTDSFRLLWIVAPHDDSDYVLECIKIRLYGLASLVSIKDINTVPTIKDCFFYFPSEFERMPLLDAAVLTMHDAGSLLVNPQSLSVDRFKKSQLYVKLQNANSVIDPDELNIQGRCYLVSPKARDSTHPHSNWAYLKTTYGVMTSIMKQSAFNGLICIKAP